jgi:DNA end-binding protein Ku
MRATANVTISFGLVSIPVQVFTATESDATHRFSQLCPDCKAKPKQVYRCGACDCDVERSAMLKGYEHVKGQYLVFTPEEVKDLAQDSTKLIEISAFIDLASVDPLFVSKPYYLGPGKGGDRPYALLAEAMRRADKCAVAQFCLRGKQYLVLLRATVRGIVLHQLYYARELREQPEGPAIDLRPEELDLAERFIDQLAGDFTPDAYTDAVYARTQEAIDAKLAGDEYVIEAPAATAPIVDLMEALKASLDASLTSAKKKAPAKARGSRKGSKARRKAS